MHRNVVLLLAFGVVFAGCTDGGAGQEDEDLPFDDPPRVAAGKGLIRGLVLAPGLHPVADAMVALTGTDLEARSDENGAFLFSDLDPGTYFVQASKPGWSTIQQSVNVEADVERPPVVRVLMEALPGTEPQVMTERLEGIIVCSIGHPLNDENCDASGQQQTVVLFDLPIDPDWIQTEIVWESTQPAGENLYVIQGVCGCGGRPVIGQRFDETDVAVSVHVARADPSYLASVDAGGESMQLWVDVSASGPALYTGVVLDQPFFVYATFFANMEPMEGWTYTSDGEHPLPR